MISSKAKPNCLTRSVRLALDLSDKIAAITPVTAQLPLALKQKIPKQPISVMIINGTEDPIVPFNGGHVRLFKFGRSRGEILSTADTIEHFRLRKALAVRKNKRRL